MIIALFGKSSTGKTTIADVLRQRLGDCPVRHCGEVVKARAHDLHLSPGTLPNEDHREIDGETRRWSETQLGWAIVEGRYLQYVLSRARAELRLIEIVCENAAREHRWANRMGRSLGPEELALIDATDRDFVTKMHNVSPPLMPGLRVDTTSRDVKVCVQQILEWL